MFRQVMAQRVDVCNRDVDGLCAAVQLRLHEPAPAALLTGLKRETTLLERVQAKAGDEANVFDLSMQRNREACSACSLASPSGAHELCSRFGGGGRARAAGIDGLPPDELTRFVCAFASARWGEAAPAAPPNVS
jgi:hypothetical protein